MKLSEIPNLIPGCSVPTENPVRKIIKQKRDKGFKTALKVALRDKKTGNPTDNANPDVRSGGDEPIDNSKVVV